MGLTLFIVPQIVVKILVKENKLNTNIMYLVFAFLLPVFWVFVPKEMVHLREVNFIQHAVGGGVAVGFVFIYFVKSLKDKAPLLNKFPFQIIGLYALVCMLGVTNELLEFLLDYLGVGIFSADRYDTWFDLVANTTGAFSVFILYKIIYQLFSKEI